MLVVVFVLPYKRFFIHCFSTSCFRELSPGFNTHFILSAQLIAEWFATLSFSPLWSFSSQLALPQVLRFWAGVFYPQAFFTLDSFPTFWHAFVTQMWAGIPIQDPPALTKLSLLADALSWTTHIVDARPLVYQLRQWATTYRAKTLLNMLQPTYACLK